SPVTAGRPHRGRSRSTVSRQEPDSPRQQRHTTTNYRHDARPTAAAEDDLLRSAFESNRKRLFSPPPRAAVQADIATYRTGELNAQSTSDIARRRKQMTDSLVRMAADSETKLQLVHRHIRSFPDFPKKGILFSHWSLMVPGSLGMSEELHMRVRLLSGSCPLHGRDICPILKEPAALTAVIDLFEEHARKNYKEVDLIVGLDARGFLFGPLLAQRLGVGFILIRKKGKLPGATMSVAYDLEYGKEDAVALGQKVLLIDDLLATGGTLFAACELMRKQQADVLGCMVIIELKELKGADKLKPHSVFSLVQY
ncbi:hypothetical protein INR49_023094, partial [Caranx melampygus]